MEVEIVAITQPLVKQGMTAGAFVAYAARVSNPANQMDEMTYPRLVQYLKEHKHWSPFEMVHAVVKIVTTRDIARQILRHRSFSFQEFSQRYAVVDSFETSKARRQDNKNRQNSIDDLTSPTMGWWDEAQIGILKNTQRVYNKALSLGIAKECARKVLPEGLTQTTLFMAGTMRSWIHYLEQRCDPATQLEHREVALAIRALFVDAVPEVFG